MSALPVHITRAAHDPICPRVSVGGSRRLGGIYCTYRGTPAECISVLKDALHAMEVMQASGKEPPIDPDIRELPRP